MALIRRLTVHRLTARLSQGGSVPLSRLVLHWYEVARQRRQLAQLDDRALADIGLTREQAGGEAGKVFWK